MYPGVYAEQHPDRPAIIMASSGEVITFRDYEARCNRFAHYLRRQGLNSGDHYAMLLENHPRFLECCGAGHRAGLYYTCINSYLTGDEVAYIVNNSESKLLVTSASRLPAARAAMRQCPNATCLMVVDEADLQANEVDFATAVGGFPETPIPDERLGAAMLYSSGTTGRPKGILRPLPDQPPDAPTPLFTFLSQLWQNREDMTYLSPAPLYHSAPNAAVHLALSHGGTVIVMERFDPEQYLQMVEKYQVTHSQLVPTMFSRMLKLPEATRMAYDLSSLEIAIHAAAPCPAQVKLDMIDWWGPIIHEYYGATEALGFAACNTEEWLAHPGTVGKVIFGDLHVLDDDMQPCPNGEPGTLWFAPATEFQYFNDPDRTHEATSSDGRLSTVGDVGYVDDDGYLYLTDRATFMIISGGVNIYPQEAENHLITHPKVADAAVFGVPNADLGEEVKAVIQPMPGVDDNDALAEELLAFCRDHLAHYKCPRSIDFEAELPRLPTGKLYKRHLRDRYWENYQSRIV